MNLKSSSIKVDSIAVVVYLIFLYSTLPLMPRMWNGISAYSQNLAKVLPGVVLFCAGVFVAMHLYMSRKRLEHFIWLLGFGVSYWIGLQMIKLPVEKLHFLEYSILAVLVFRLLRHLRKGVSVYIWSAFLVALLGLIDEVIQYYLPMRSYDLRDVLVNAIAGILGLGVIAFCFQPRLDRR